MTPDMHVLVVDDEPAIRDLAAELLEHVSDVISAETVADPGSVPDRVADHAVDCVVSDYHMPRIDGLQLCARLREVNPNLPFILFTSSTDRRLIDRALEMGATDYIQKQPGVEHYHLLAHSIEQAVAHHRDQARLAELTPGP